MTRRLIALLALVLATTLVPSAAFAYDAPPEGYAGYQPQTRCPRAVKPGTVVLARWVDRHFTGGRAVAALRPCGAGGTSEHKEGRAIDWMMNAGVKADRLEVRRFLRALFAADAQGHPHWRARRMGVMYVIWNDRMWASYDRFAVKRYTGGSRHRDHVHISLSRPGGRGATSWYDGRL